MKKLILDVDALAVESFETDRAARAAGTVLGHQQTRNCGSSQCWTETCPPTEGICITVDLACVSQTECETQICGDSVELC